MCNRWLLLVLLFLGILGFAPSPSDAAGPRAPVPGVAPLLNADLQGDTYPVGIGSVAAGWKVFMKDPGNVPPAFEVATDADGRRFQRIHAPETGAAGLYQTLAFPEGTAVTFSATGGAGLTIAVDPHGGMDPLDARVVSAGGASPSLSLTLPGGNATFFAFARGTGVPGAAPVEVFSLELSGSIGSTGPSGTTPGPGAAFPALEVRTLTPPFDELSKLTFHQDDGVAERARKLHLFARLHAGTFNASEWNRFRDNFRWRGRRGADTERLVALVSGGMAIRESLQLESITPLRGRQIFQSGHHLETEAVTLQGGRIFFRDDNFDLLVDSRYFGLLPFRQHTVGSSWTDAAGSAEVAIATDFLKRNTDVRRMLVRCPDFALIVSNPEAAKRRASPPSPYAYQWANPSDDFLSVIDRAYSGRPEPPRVVLPGTAAVDLQAVSIRSHDYVEMTGSREVTVPRALGFVPKDMVAAWFTSVRRSLEIGDDIEAWGGNLMTIWSPESGTGALKSRIETQLCLRVNPLARPFYDLAVGTMTLAATDLALADGAGLGVIFEVKNRALFEGTLEKYRSEFLAKFPGSKRTEQDLAGAKCLTIESPGRELACVAGWLPDGIHYVVANDQTTFRRLQETARAAAGPNLSTEPDVRYLLSTAPKTQDAFLVLSDAAIRYMVSPVFRIGASRRLQCFAVQEDLALALPIYRSAYRTETETTPRVSTPRVPTPAWPPSTPGVSTDVAIDAMAREGLLAELPVCPDQGVLRHDAALGAYRCSVHDRPGLGIPVAALPSPIATDEEFRTFERFRTQYHSFFRNFFDPVLISLTRTGKGFALRTVILPLIEHSEYNWFRAIAGGAPNQGTLETKLPASTIAYFALKLTPFEGYKPAFKHLEGGSDTDEARMPLREVGWFHKEIVRSLDWKDPQDVLDWVAPRALVFARDSEIDMAHRRRAMDIPKVALAIASRKPELLKLFFTVVASKIAHNIEPPRRRSRGPLGGVGRGLFGALGGLHAALEMEPVGSGQIYTFPTPFFMADPFNAAIGWDEDAFLLATDRDLAHAFLSDAPRTPFGHRHREARALAGVTEASNLGFGIDFAAIDKARSLLAVGILDVDRTVCETRRDRVRLEAWIRGEAMTTFAKDTCLRGGEITGNDKGEARCSLHSSPNEKPGRVYPDPDRESPEWKASRTRLEKDARAHLDKILGEVDFFEGSLSFTPEGIVTRLFFGR